MLFLSAAHRSPVFCTALRHRPDGERFAVDAVVDLLPGQRRRNAGVVAGARAVGGRQRLAEDVLQVVDVDALAARRHASRSTVAMLRMLLRDDGRDDLAEEQAGFVRRARRQRHVDVQAVGARRFRHADRRRARRARRESSARRRARARTARLGRIEIERRIVGELRRCCDAREPRILRDRRELRRVEQRLQIAADDLRTRRRRRSTTSTRTPVGTSSARGAGRTAGAATPLGNRFITSGRSATAGRMNGATCA